MKILFITHTCSISGTSHLLLNLIDELKDKNEFIVITFCMNQSFIEIFKIIGSFF